MDHPEGDRVQELKQNLSLKIAESKNLLDELEDLLADSKKLSNGPLAPGCASLLGEADDGDAGHGDWAMLSTIQSVGDDQEGAEDGSAAPAQDGEEGHRPRRRSLSLKRQLSNVRARYLDFMTDGAKGSGSSKGGEDGADQPAEPALGHSGSSKGLGSKLKSKLQGWFGPGQAGAAAGRAAEGEEEGSIHSASSFSQLNEAKLGRLSVLQAAAGSEGGMQPQPPHSPRGSIRRGKGAPDRRVSFSVRPPSVSSAGWDSHTGCTDIDGAADEHGSAAELALVCSPTGPAPVVPPHHHPHRPPGRTNSLPQLVGINNSNPGSKSFSTNVRRASALMAVGGGSTGAELQEGQGLHFPHPPSAPRVPPGMPISRGSSRRGSIELPSSETHSNSSVSGVMQLNGSVVAPLSPSAALLPTRRPRTASQLLDEATGALLADAASSLAVGGRGLGCAAGSLDEGSTGGGLAGGRGSLSGAGLSVMAARSNRRSLEHSAACSPVPSRRQSMDASRRRTSIESPDTSCQSGAWEVGAGSQSGVPPEAQQFLLIRPGSLPSGSRKGSSLRSKTLDGPALRAAVAAATAGDVHAGVLASMPVTPAQAWMEGRRPESDDVGGPGGLLLRGGSLAGSGRQLHGSLSGEAADAHLFLDGARPAMGRRGSSEYDSPPQKALQMPALQLSNLGLGAPQDARASRTKSFSMVSFDRSMI